VIGYILAAGFGTRLRPLTDHIPKALVPLAGRPLLEHALSFLKRNGIEKIGVNTHYRAEDIVQFRETSEIDFTIFHETPDILGTGGALYNASDFLKMSDTFIVANADIVARFNLQKQVQFFLQSDELCRLICFPPANSEGTVFYSNESNEYHGTSYSETDGISIRSADFIGITLYRKEVFSYITQDDFSIIPVWNRIKMDGKKISVSVIENGYWKDLGTPWKYAEAHFDCITGNLQLEKPDGLEYDFESKVCFPSSWNVSERKRLKHSCWIECDVPYGNDLIENCIVLKSAAGHLAQLENNVLYSKWGGISLNG